jgi:hypothetical protein
MFEYETSTPTTEERVKTLADSYRLIADSAVTSPSCVLDALKAICAAIVRELKP